MSAEVEIIAHRGASGEAPENTLSAFRLAWEQGADAVELDIHLTQDRQLVVIHDSNTRRTTGVRHWVRRQTAQTLTQLDAGAWKGLRFKGEPIPLLAEVLATTPPGRRVFIEVKGGAECVEPLSEVLAGAPVSAAQTPFLTFEWDLAKALQERFPDHEVGWNIDRPWKSPRIEKIQERARAAGLSTLSFCDDWPLTAELVAQLHERGFRVYVWTVDDVAQARRYIEANVTGVMTNVPARIIQGWLQGPAGSVSVS